MKDLTLKFADRTDFSAFMDSTGYYDEESMQDDILIDVIGNVYKETGERLKMANRYVLRKMDIL